MRVEYVHSYLCVRVCLLSFICIFLIFLILYKKHIDFLNFICLEKLTLWLIMFLLGWNSYIKPFCILCGWRRQSDKMLFLIQQLTLSSNMRLEDAESNTWKTTYLLIIIFSQTKKEKKKTVEWFIHPSALPIWRKQSETFQ